MQQLLPLLLDWLSAGPRPRPRPAAAAQPAHGGPARPPRWPRPSATRPRRPGALCQLLGTSRLLGDVARRTTPTSSPACPTPTACATRDRDELVDQRRRGRSAWRDDARRAPAGAAALEASATCSASRPATCSATPTSTTVGADLTAAGRGVPRGGARRRSSPPIPFAVIGLGRFGGGELSYASDLDVVFVYDGEGAAGADEAKRVATGAAALRRRQHAGRPHLRHRRRPPARGPAGPAGPQPRRLRRLLGASTP